MTNVDEEAKWTQHQPGALKALTEANHRCMSSYAGIITASSEHMEVLMIENSNIFMKSHA
jgi:hypothetical protein